MRQIIYIVGTPIIKINLVHHRTDDVYGTYFIAIFICYDLELLNGHFERKLYSLRLQSVPTDCDMWPPIRICGNEFE